MILGYTSTKLRNRNSNCEAIYGKDAFPKSDQRTENDGQ
jgi:hypothetical protein